MVQSMVSLESYCEYDGRVWWTCFCMGGKPGKFEISNVVHCLLQWVYLHPRFSVPAPLPEIWVFPWDRPPVTKYFATSAARFPISPSSQAGPCAAWPASFCTAWLVRGSSWVSCSSSVSHWSSRSATSRSHWRARNSWTPRWSLADPNLTSPLLTGTWSWRWREPLWATRGTSLLTCSSQLPGNVWLSLWYMELEGWN